LDRDKWRDVAYMVMNFQLPKDAKDVSASWGTFNFSSAEL
jgi:hypothetical protein